MDTALLARLQFAMTVGFHFLFPPISIGLAWLLVIMETIGWRREDERYTQLGKFFGRLLGLTFIMGVATGIVMEFQFGTNWSEYSKFVGDIFGAPLAAEGVFAFFLESVFLGLYLFGRNRLPRAVHWFSALMVAVGSTISAFWILVANSWMQTPAGYVLRNGRAELTSFWGAVFNPSTGVRFFHTVDAALITGAFFVAGVSAYLIRHGRGAELARRSLRIAVIFGLIVSVLEVFPFGHEHAQQVAATQPEKFAAIQGIYATQNRAPIALFAIPTTPPPALVGAVEIPGLLSWLAFGDVNATIPGIADFPPDQIPPLFLTFVSYHNMVVLGILFIVVMALSVWRLRGDRLYGDRRLLRILVWSIPFPLFACQLGWMTAEVGRQPWIAYHLMRTGDAVSPVVGGGELAFSLVLFGLIYLALGVLWIYLMVREIRRGPESAPTTEVYA